MGHRHVLQTPQIFETDDNQEWNHAEQPSLHTVSAARVGASDSSAHIHPVDNMTIQGRQSASQWTAAHMPSGYSSSNLNVGLPHYQPQVPGPSHNPFLHQPPAGNFLIPQENYSHHASSSNLPRQTVPRVDGGSSDPTVGNGRGPYKRKRHGIPPMHDASRYHDVGSSSDLPLPSDPWQEMQTTESYHTPWEHPPSYMVNSVCIGGEGALRNVRSRAAVDVENNLVRTHLSSNSLHHSFSSLSSDQSSLVDFWGQSSNAPTREWNRRVISTAGHDTSFSRHEPNMNTVNSYPSASLEIGGSHNGVTSNRNSVLPNVQGNLSPPIRGVRSLNGQRYAPTSRPSNNLCPGHVTASDDGPQMVAESYPSRHPRAFPTVRFRNIDGNGRNSDRYRSFTEDPSLRDRMPAEGLVGHSAFYGSRYPFDQHTGMRLDIDNMSYEELLALGERIGNVSTGLSEALISKSLTESIYCSSDQFQEGKCIICLEEYKNLDDVGTLNICRHDFHVSCIRKWLSIKNSCPICKASALDDSTKEK
ncbi:RING/U-box superfamily protein [Forsythia ovata]|uniref:RING-type E3 ubiquitin transferase n=1 Tax=Forsythia ovata TaxID=205694 RepID=A0ABD1SPY6_9LAMI